MNNKQRKKRTVLSFEVKKNLIHDYYEKGLNQKQLSEKYNVSHPNVSIICRNFKLYGNEGLKSSKIRKHKRIQYREGKSAEKEILKLKQKNYELEMENKILKKLKEFLDEQKTSSPKNTK